MVIFYVGISILILSFIVENDKESMGNCWISLVENVPQTLVNASGSSSYLSSYEGLLSMIEAATDTIEIATFHRTLPQKDENQVSETQQETSLFEHVLSAGEKRKIEIRIIENKPTDHMQSLNTKILIEKELASVGYIDMKQLMGRGILHSNLWIIDRKHFYIGTVNLDWNSKTQMRDLGIIISNCKFLAEDLGKIFDGYWHLTKVDTIPQEWSQLYGTKINKDNPLKINFNNSNSDIYLTSSPPFCSDGRTTNIDAILDVIYSAKKFIHISLMDYAPALEFQQSHMYWQAVLKALRNVSDNVEVLLLGKYLKQTKASMFNFLQSLLSVDTMEQNKIQVKMFELPYSNEKQDEHPSAWINHNKYMVTDSAAYVGTSNWSGDYFVSSAGLGLVVRPTDTASSSSSSSSSSSLHDTFSQQLESVFQRDWNSNYSRNLYNSNPTKT
ncbi:phospholipase D3-like [Argonauta hians]